MNPLWRATVVLCARAFALYGATLRVRGVRLPDDHVMRVDDYPFGPEIFALSERDALLVGAVAAHRRITVMVAHGRDGDWASAAAEAVGYRVVRGSSGLGGWQGLHELTARLRRSTDPGAFVVDGPLGPDGFPKPGIIISAARTGRPVRPVGAWAAWRIVFRKTWSQIYLPLPFSRVWIVVGEPCTYGSTPRSPEIAMAVEDLARRLAAARESAAGMAVRP